MRLYQALYKSPAAEWMRAFADAHPELAAAPDRSAVDPVWRTAMTAQMIKGASPGSGRMELSAVTMLVDIRKLFDTLPPMRAVDAALQAGLPC